MRLWKIIPAFAIMLSANAQANTTWKVGNKNFDVDTLTHITVGPGTTETELRLINKDGNTSTMLNIFYTQTELQNQYVEMRAAKAGSSMRMLETVPEIGKRMDKEGERYFAGVNSDFFNTGYPFNAIGMTVSNGTPTNYATDWADIDPYYIWFNSKGLPNLARHINPAWEGTVTYPSGEKYGFFVNTKRSEGELILYSPQWVGVGEDAGTTGTNAYGSEVSVRPTGNKKILYGNRQKLEVIGNVERGVGNKNIPADGYVLSAHGAACELLETLKPGDIITTDIDFSADGMPATVKELLGGFPFLVKNGARQSTPGYPEHLSTKEPRTAVGYDTNRTKLTMLVVDGRNAGGSAGVTQPELTAIMLNLGCANAMNFDGGGSSTMYLSQFGVRNVPSSSSLDKNRPEGTPRTGVNALFAVATSPEDNEVASIEIKEKKLNLITDEEKGITVYGYNQYGVMVNSNLSGYTITLPEEIGTITGSKIKAKSGKYSGLLTVNYGNASYSIPVYLNGGGTFVDAAVAEIEIDNSDATPEYFNTMGVKLNNPVPGQIVIVRRGSKVSKEIYR